MTGVLRTALESKLLTVGVWCVIIDDACGKFPATERGYSMSHLLQSIMLVFDVSSLLKARIGKSFTLHIDTGPKVLDDLEVAYLDGSVQAIKVEEGIYVEGTVETELRLECDRCLESFPFPVTLELAELFTLPGNPPTPESLYAVSEDGEIDLAPLVREYAWLAIPMKHLCDPECKGLCPHCGVNLNVETCQCEDTHVDPRLAPLQELLKG